MQYINAKSQYQLSSIDLQVMLALVRCKTLVDAGERLKMDSSTVFRHIQRIERGLGQPLFARSREGYKALDLAMSLASQAEVMESALESARSLALMQPDTLTGIVRISTTDAILHGLLTVCLAKLHLLHPLLVCDLCACNNLVSLTKRESDIVIRATKNPPDYLVGKKLGDIQYSLYVSRRSYEKRGKTFDLNKAPWIALDNALQEHPTVIWRKKYFPNVATPFYVNCVTSAMEFVSQGGCVGLLPTFLTRGNPELVQLTDVLDDCHSALWLLTHAQTRHSPRIKTVYSYLLDSLSTMLMNPSCEPGVPQS